MVLQRMEAAGVTLNEKCAFSVNKIKFIGHIKRRDPSRPREDKSNWIWEEPQKISFESLKEKLSTAPVL